MKSSLGKQKTDAWCQSFLLASSAEPFTKTPQKESLCTRLIDRIIVCKWSSSHQNVFVWQPLAPVLEINKNCSYFVWHAGTSLGLLSTPTILAIHSHPPAPSLCISPSSARFKSKREPSGGWIPTKENLAARRMFHPVHPCFHVNHLGFPMFSIARTLPSSLVYASIATTS